MNAHRWGRRVLLGAALVVGMAAFTTYTSSFAQVSGNRQKDVAELQKLTGGDVKVSVHLINNPTVITGRIKSLASVLGKTYLQLQGDGTELVVINVDAVAAIRQVFN